MPKRIIELLKNQSQVKVVASARNNQQDESIWLVTVAATLFAVAVYFFSFFFGFTGGGRALTQS